ATMNSNYGAVLNLFQQVSPAGFASNFNNDLLNMTDPTNGPIALDQNGIAQSTAALNQQISDFQDNLNLQEQQLMQTYSQVAVTLQEMPTLLQQVQSQLGSASNRSRNRHRDQTRDAAAAYRRRSIEGSSPVGLIVLLYQGVTVDLRRAIAAIEHGRRADDIEART